MALKIRRYMRTEGSLRRKIWKYWQTLIGRWRKERKKKMTIEDAGIYGILVLDDKNNYESQWTDRLVLVDIYCRTSIWNT